MTARSTSAAGIGTVDCSCCQELSGPFAERLFLMSRCACRKKKAADEVDGVDGVTESFEASLRAGWSSCLRRHTDYC